MTDRGPGHRSADRRRITVDSDPQAVDDLRHALKGFAAADVVPAATPVAGPGCRRCATEILPPIGVCPRCGEPVPDHADDPLYLVLRSGPARPLAKREAVRLLSDAGPELHADEVERQLRDLPALFRAPLPEAMAHRLAERLRRCGYRVEVRDTFPTGLGFTEYLESLVSRTSRLLPYVACAALASGLFFLHAPALAAGGASLAGPWCLYDRYRFLRRLTLASGLLANRVDMAPEDVADRVGTLLRDGALSERLRGLLSALLGEYARVLDTLSPLGAQYPDVLRPMRQALAQLVRHAAHLAEKALSVEKAGDFSDPGLDDRLAGLRALGSEEIERRVHALFAARDEREGHVEWLREVYGTLLVRLESITDTLRSVRQRILETYVAAEAEAGSKVVDELVETLRREQGVVSDTVTEMEKLDRHMSEMVIE